MYSLKYTYSISSYSFHKNYSFLNFEFVVTANFNFLPNKLNICCRTI